MDLKQLSYFLTIVEHQNLSKAAETLHLAQPALSRQLKQLESELGMVLIDRTTRSFQITEAGKHLAHRGRQLLTMADTLKQEMAALGGGKTGTIRLGVIGSEMEIMLPHLMASFSSDYPQVHFKCHEGSSLEILDNLQRGVIDLGIVRSPVDFSAYHYFKLPPQPMVAASLTRPEWLKESETKATHLNWADLKDERLIVLNRYAEEIQRNCRLWGFEPNIVVGTEDTRSLLLMASTGMGTAIVQQDWLKMVPTQFYWKTIEAPELETQTLILWQKDRYLPEAARHFIAYAKEVLVLEKGQIDIANP